MDSFNHWLLTIHGQYWNSWVKCIVYFRKMSLNKLIPIPFKQSRGAVDPISLLFALLSIYWSFVQMFIFCNFGENINDHFSRVDDTIYDCDWYTFPKEIQRMLPVVMISAQRPVTLTGFANFSCTRQAFKKVYFSNKNQ